MSSQPAGAGLRLGAPGVYQATVTAAPGFEPVRLDVTGFVGVAPRGPLDEPVTVESWTQYRWRFGGAAGPGLLGLAVQAFFAQGGVRALILRVAPRPAAAARPAADPAAGRARLQLVVGGPAGQTVQLELLARDEGSWGGGLQVTLDFDVTGHLVLPVVGASGGSELELPAGGGPAAGSLLRLRADGMPPAGAFRWLDAVRQRDDAAGRRLVALLDQPLPAAADQVDVDVVTGTITITDTATDMPRDEVFDGVGLRMDHPLFLGRRLAEESRLVEPAADWPEALQPLDPLLTGARSTVTAPGQDRYGDVGPGSFFGADDVGMLPIGGTEPVEEASAYVGVDRMSLEPSIGLLVVPDLLWSAPVPVPPTTVVLPAAPAPGPRFAPCPAEAIEVTHQLAQPAAALLDGRTELAEILRRQARVVALAERQRRFVALLDVPMLLPLRTVARWRAQVDSSYAAAYHPWLGIVPSDAADLAALPAGTGTRLLAPSAVAAGVIAERERSLGLPWGPANVVATSAVAAADPVPDADADALHLLDIGVFRPGPDGFRLSAAHTLSRDPQYRQLTVRRLMTMLRLVLDRQAQWLAFEPDDERLRTLLRGDLLQLLRDLFRAGAFSGATEEESFFVQCDDALNPPSSQALGRLIAEVGVAPSRPLEYLVLRIARRTDTGLAVEG